MANCTSEDGTPTNDASPSRPSSVFKPIDRSKEKPALHLPDELWLTILESPCRFPPDIFSGVVLNLIKNPNITSSHLFRADIFYDSESDHAPSHDLNSQPDSGLPKHLKQEYQPVRYELTEYKLERTIVRQLVPRNPQLDKPLVQTYHFFRKIDTGVDATVVVLIPHVQHVEDIPFYHPAVSRLALMHVWRAAGSEGESGTREHDEYGSISISYSLFSETMLSTKLERTALRLLQTMHKHGQGQLAGYEKRVHLDQVIPQKKYQDTYARLKAKYGKQLSEQWVEVTDPGKHVFEDIGIAAFLIELWRDMYSVEECKDEAETKKRFPGFVDIGCGNGVLVYILVSEGYEGSGFDARKRKTWRIFPDYVQEKLQRRVLVPSVFQNHEDKSSWSDWMLWSNGMFAPETFIISNHADELTTWTPLLAYRTQSSFIAIPCCSHDLQGARFRAPLTTKAAKLSPTRLPQQDVPTDRSRHEFDNNVRSSLAAETGSLIRTEAQKKMPSAYSSLCSYVTSLAEEVGFETEREALRIPSTRNQCIIGRRMRTKPKIDILEGIDESRQTVVEIVERELGKSLEAAGLEWIQRTERVAKKPGSGH